MNTPPIPVGADKGQQKRSLLIVEDDNDIREALDGLLRMEGYDVTGVANGLEALHYLRRSPPPDVILLDLMMPVMDGWQFRVEQKRDPSLAAIPVVALSADTTSKAAAIDAEAYLKKPVDYDTLIATIERLMLRLEHQRLEARLAQTARLTSLGTLAAGVAHEINNPLAYVLLNLSFASEQLGPLLDACTEAAGASGARSPEAVAVLESKKKQFSVALTHATEGAERIRSIVRGLKTFSRPEDEGRSAVDVRSVMESSLGIIANEVRHRARVVKDYAAVPPVDANEARLGQVFLNLLLNAAQALPEGSSATSEIRIVIRSVVPSGEAGPRATPESVVIEVHDTGVGIPQDIRGRIFEPFFTTKPVGLGTGLGLAICHGIVTSLGGKLSVDSEVGKGSVFRVELPVAETSRARTPSVPPAVEKGVLRGRILVVDDEPIICFTLERLLSTDHDVTAVTNAEDALRRVVSGVRYDLILCDLMMPGMGGDDLHRELERLAPDQAERMVFVTGGAFTTRSQQFLERVKNLRVDKPFDVASLLALVRDQLMARGSCSKLNG